MIQWLSIHEVKFYKVIALKHIIDYIEFDYKTPREIGTVKELKMYYNIAHEKKGKAMKEKAGRSTKN